MPCVRRSLIVAGLAFLAGAAVAGDEDPAKKPAAPVEPETGSEAATRALSAEERARRLTTAMRELVSGLSSVKSLRAKFTQTKHLDVFDEDVVSVGTLAIAMPTRLRWEYTSPVHTVLIVNGPDARRERTSRKGEKTAKKFALAEDPVAATTAEQVFLWNRGDFENGRKKYEFELVSEKPLEIRVTPTDERIAKVVASIDLRFTDDRKSLVRVVLAEKTKTRTVIAFTDVERNLELAEALFRVED